MKFPKKNDNVWEEDENVWDIKKSYDYTKKVRFAEPRKRENREMSKVVIEF